MYILSTLYGWYDSYYNLVAAYPSYFFIGGIIAGYMITSAMVSEQVFSALNADTQWGVIGLIAWNIFLFFILALFTWILWPFALGNLIFHAIRRIENYRR